MSSEKTQRKALDAVGRLLPAGVGVRAYGVGRANARMSTRVTYIIVGFLVALVVVAVATGRVFIPGVLVFVFFYSAIKPVRGIAVLDAVIVVVSVTATTGKPKAVLGELPHAVLLPPHIHWLGDKAVQVPLGPDVVKVRAGDYERLTASLTTPHPAYSAPSGSSGETGSGAAEHCADLSAIAPPGGTGPGWYPVDGNQHRQGYWNGTAWTAMKSWDGQAWVDAETSRH